MSIQRRETLKPASPKNQRPVGKSIMLSDISVYLEFAKKSFQRHLQYRTANYAGFIVNVFFFVVRAYVFMALYENRDIVGGFSVVDAITYTGITQAMLMTVGIFGRGAREIAESVRSGQVATDLMKPIDYHFFALFRQIGGSVYYFIFRGLPIFMVMVLFFEWNPPHSFQAFILFLFSLGLASIISFSFSFMTGISAFWLMDISGMQQMVMGTGMFMSGFLVPVAYFPSGFAKVCEWMPFIGQGYISVAIYLGKYTGIHMANMLIRQIIWAIILTLLCRALMAFATRKLVIQGG